jgi:phage terminase large subunit-like protein
MQKCRSWQNFIAFTLFGLLEEVRQHNTGIYTLKTPFLIISI